MADAMGLPGGPAFPISIPGFGDNGCEGMSLRDWFAGMAIATMIGKSENHYGGWDPATVAAGCYIVADAMLEAREPSRDRHLSRPEQAA